MKISGFDEIIISVEFFEYQSRVDHHETCFFSAWIKQEDADKAREKAGQDVTFEDEENHFKFTGHVTDVATSYDISGVRIEVNSIGKSYLADQVKVSRVFQNGAKTLSDILSELKKASTVDYPNIDYPNKSKGDKENPKIKSILFQDDETDWSFIVRLANRYGLRLFPQEKTFIGRYDGKGQVKLEEEDLIGFKLTTGEKSSSMVCSVAQSLDLGSRVKYSGKEYYAASKKYVLEHERYYYEYELREITEDSEVKPDLTNVYLYAKVTDNKDPELKGRLRVSFENKDFQDCCDTEVRAVVADSCKKDAQVWIDRMDAYAHEGLGPAYIPQVGDIVRVHLYRGDARIIGCVRTEPYGAPYKEEKCNDKFLLLDKDVYLQFSEGKITVCNKDNQSQMSDEKILIQSGDKAVVSVSKDKVLMQKDKTAIQLTADITVKAQSDASISGSKVKIKGTSGVSLN